MCNTGEKTDGNNIINANHLTIFARTTIVTRYFLKTMWWPTVIVISLHVFALLLLLLLPLPLLLLPLL